MRNFLFLCLILSFGTVNANFSDGYDVINWSQSLDGGVIDLSGAPDSVNLISNNLGTGAAANTDFTTTALADGMVSFDWVFMTADEGPDYDPFGYLVNDIFTQLTLDGSSGSQSGSTMFAVLAGDIFGFSARTLDSQYGSGTTTLTNFSAPDVSVSAVPVPAAAWLFASALLGFFGVKRLKYNS